MNILDLTPTTDAEKAMRLPPLARPGQTLTQQANSMSGKDPHLSSDAPAAGPRPEPGPLPQASAAVGDDARHQPLRWQFPYATNQTFTPRGAMTPFAVLRGLADIHDVIRACIEVRKDQMTSMEWDIVSRDKRNLHEAKVQAAKQLFMKPDKRRGFQTWFRMAIEEVLVIDALSIYRRRTRGGQLYALELKDGATFKPLLDETGDTPMAPNIAYRQIIYGQPVAGGDCTVDDLLYRPRTVRTWTPYGLSPTEAVLLTVNAALLRESFNLQYYTEGNVPEGLIDAPAGYTVQQIKELQEYMDDYLTGNLAKRRRLKIVGNGTAKSLQQFKEPEFKTDWDEWMVYVVCAAFAVPPQEIGFTGDVNKATGEQQENVSYRRGVKPLGGFFKELFDEILAVDLQSPELQWVWKGGEVEDKLLTAQTDAIYVAMGKTSVDELRARDGQEPIGLGNYIETAMGPVFVTDLLAGAVPDDDLTSTETGDAGDDDLESAEQLAAEGDDDKTPEEVEDRGLTEDAKKDIARWRSIVIKHAKQNTAARRPFVSEHIPRELQAAITHRLSKVSEASACSANADVRVGAVVKAFDSGAAAWRAMVSPEVRKASKEERAMTKRLQVIAKKHFARQRKALIAHLSK